jgi:hypothetical protein
MHWGGDPVPALLIFDSKLTTQAVLAGLDDRGIGFITLRARHPGATKALAALHMIPPPGAGPTRRFPASRYTRQAATSLPS